MNTHVFSCMSCGAPLPVVDGQWVTLCRYCNHKHYIPREQPPALVLKPAVDGAEARNTVLEGLKHQDVSKSFPVSSTFERAVLYFIPFFEARGIKAGVNPAADGKGTEFAYLSYEYMEKASDLRDLGELLFDFSIVEEAVLSGEHQPFDPVAMRKQGMVIPPQNLAVLCREDQERGREELETFHRVIYFPVWEIGYNYQGVLFKSYVSAVDGRPLKIQALRCHKKKLRFAFFGLWCLAIMLGRAINAGTGGILMVVLLVLPLSIPLLPFFWERFAFQEMVEIYGDTAHFKTINYTENSFLKFSRKLVEGVTGMSGKQSDDK